MPAIPTEALDLLGPPHHAVVATIASDGSPQLSPVWITHDDGIPSFNTAVGRAKVVNLERDARCTFVVFDTHDPHRYVQVRGRARIVADDDLAHCQALAHQYTGAPFRELEPGEVRVAIHIDPDRAHYQAGD